MCSKLKRNTDIERITILAVKFARICNSPQIIYKADNGSYNNVWEKYFDTLSGATKLKRANADGTVTDL